MLWGSYGKGKLTEDSIQFTGYPIPSTACLPSGRLTVDRYPKSGRKLADRKGKLADGSIELIERKRKH